jgi:DNA-binding phage protein
LAENTQPIRESLYMAQSAGAKPRYEAMIKVINALGVQLQVVPVAAVLRSHKIATI